MINERLYREIMDPLTDSQIRNWHIAVARIALAEKETPGSIGFYIMFRDPYVISVGLKRSSARRGTWLFDANSSTEVEKLLADGMGLQENPTDMILRGLKPTISEINRKLPGFLKRNHPDLASLIDINRQRLPARKDRSKAA